MRSRKGFELSVNFIVTFILAIVLFGMGIIFARMIVGGGTELTEETYAQFDKQIGDLVCSRGESICVSVGNKEIDRQKVDVFPITVKNEFPYKAEFRMTVEIARAFDKNNNNIAETSWDISLLYNEDEFSLDAGDSETLPILVRPEEDTASGRYSFNIWVESRDPSDSASVFEKYPDEKPNKFYVDVS